MTTAVEDMYFLHHRMRKEKINRKRHASDSGSDFQDDSISPKSASPGIDDDRRAHHNELERRRRDHIKDHFITLKDAIPYLEGEKTSRALILKRAVEYIDSINAKDRAKDKRIEELSRRNEMLEEKLLERESSSTPPSARLPCLGATPIQMCQITPLTQIQPIQQVISPIPQLPQNPVALSTMDPAHLNSLIASSQDAIIALTQSLIGNMHNTSPSLPDSASVSPPAGLYPLAYSPEQQMPIRFQI